FQDGKLGCLDKRAGAAKLHRVLTNSPAYHASQCPAFFEECAIGKLLVSATGDQILDHDLTSVPDQRGGPLEERFQFSASIGAPGFGLRRVEKVLFDCRLDSQRQISIDLSDIIQVVWIPDRKSTRLNSSHVAIS